MNKSLYYIECTCIKDVIFPNVTFHVGDVVYYNSNAASNEMYMFNYNTQDKLANYNAQKYCSIKKGSYLPFTRKKQNAKKWQIKSYADWTVNIINSKEDFNAVIKEIKITYTVEE